MELASFQEVAGLGGGRGQCLKIRGLLRGRVGKWLLGRLPMIPMLAVWSGSVVLKLCQTPEVPEISMSQYFFFHCYSLFRCVDRSHFIISPVGENLGCFHFLSVANNVAVNIPLQVSVWTHFFWVYTWE